MKKAARKQPADTCFFIVTVLLVVGGILLVFDSSFARAGDKGLSNSWYFVNRQMVFAAIGFLGMFVAMKIHPEKIRAVTKIFVPFSIMLLAAVMIPGVGKSIGGAARWIPIGPFHLQPSEVAKLAVIFYLADRLSAKGPRVRRFWVLLPHLAVAGLIVLLVLVEPDMGTASSLVFTMAAMFFAAGVKKRYMFSLATVGVAAGCLLVYFEPYRWERVLTFFDPSKDYYGSGYQITHALIALATGGLTGKGLCEGCEKYFIPAPQTDMIAATLAEEWGLIGMLLLLTLFIIFTYRGLSIGYRARSTYMEFLAIGITSLVSIQALMNIAVFTASIPATGVPLPFISYGGSHLMMMLVGAGVVLSVSRHLDEKMKEPELEAYENRCNRRRYRRTYLSCAEYRPSARRGRRRRTPVRR